jgi:predicted permease
MFIEFIELFGFAFGVTGPIFLLVLLGIVLKKLRVIDDTFTNTASRLVFVVAMPTMLFMSMINTDIRSLINLGYLAYGLAATFVVFVFFSLLTPFFVKDKRDYGVFVQGAFRGNLAIVGLAFSFNAYGAVGLATASILMSVMTILYNLLSIYTLSASLSGERVKISQLVANIAKNPLIIALVSGMIVSLFDVSFPEFMVTSGEYVAQMTLPLALICIGGAMSLAELRNSSSVATIAVFAKLIISPVVIVYPAYLLGFEAMELGVLFLMVSAPTAAASYIMVQAMGGNGKLAANIVVISTLASVMTVSVGLALLKQVGVV